MNGNSSKQVLLSVLGIAVLVVAVVGVSFAFFTYSKAGTTGNTITTGSIFLRFTEGTAITLTDQFPVSDREGATLGGTSTLTFHVVGFNGSNKELNYTISADVPGDTAPTYTAPNPAHATDEEAPETIQVARTRLHDNGIKLWLEGPAYGAATNYTNNFGTHTNGTDGVADNADDVYGALVSTQLSGNNTLANGITLATGKITTGSEASPQDDTYTLHMWISNEEVSIDNVSGGDVNTSGNVYTSDAFGKLYYSIRVKVDASANINS